MASAAQKCLPHTVAEAHRPWISQRTLETIELRNQARVTNQHGLEQTINKLIKQMAKADRRVWLDEQLAAG